MSMMDILAELKNKEERIYSLAVDMAVNGKGTYAIMQAVAEEIEITEEYRATTGKPALNLAVFA